MIFCLGKVSLSKVIVGTLECTNKGVEFDIESLNFLALVFSIRLYLNIFIEVLLFVPIMEVCNQFLIVLDKVLQTVEERPQEPVKNSILMIQVKITHKRLR